MNQINPRVPRKQQSSGDDDNNTAGLAPRYGAEELKSAYSRYLLYGLGISAGLFILLSGSYTVLVSASKAEPKQMARAPVRVEMLKDAPPPAEDNAPPPPPPIVPENLRGTGGGLAAVIGKPKAVPDATIDPTLKPLADFDDMANATTKMGDGTGIKVDEGALDQKMNLDNKQTDVKTKEEPPPGIDDFVPVEKEANYDEGDLQRRIKYPPAARDQGIQGTVIVRALIDKFGKVKDVVIDQSANKILEKAAVDAVKDTPFTPAEQNGSPVVTWKQVNVEFKLE